LGFVTGFVPCLDGTIHAAGDLNQKLTFVASILLTSFAHALLGIIRYNPSCPLHLGINTFGVVLIQVARMKPASSHVVLHGHNSGTASTRQLFKRSKDSVSWFQIFYG